MDKELFLVARHVLHSSEYCRFIAGVSLFEIAARHTLHSSEYARFMAGGSLSLAQWVWLFEALLHAGCDIADRWAVVKQRIDGHPLRQGIRPIELMTLEERLAVLAIYGDETDQDLGAEHLAMIDSIKRELAAL